MDSPYPKPDGLTFRIYNTRPPRNLRAVLRIRAHTLLKSRSTRTARRPVTSPGDWPAATAEATEVETTSTSRALQALAHRKGNQYAITTFRAHKFVKGSQVWGQITSTILSKFLIR